MPFHGTTAPQMEPPKLSHTSDNFRGFETLLPDPLTFASSVELIQLFRHILRHGIAVVGPRERALRDLFLEFFQGI